jgi:hypothetical protein
LEGSIARRPNQVLVDLLPEPSTLIAMNRGAYHGEVWTDGRGFATVLLPAEARPLEPPLDYELRDLDPPGSARVTAGLQEGRFTIATDQPHVKVAWRISGRKEEPR